MEKVKVLIVDDQRFFIDALKIYFSFYDFIEVSGEACNGEEALSLLKESDHNVVLIDYVMPVMDGIELLSQLKDLPKSFKTIFMSSYSSQSLSEKSIELGADFFIPKSLASIHLVHSIVRVLKGETGFIYKETIY